MRLGLRKMLGTDFVLVKPDGRRVPGRGIRDSDKNKVLVEDTSFPVAARGCHAPIARTTS